MNVKRWTVVVLSGLWTTLLAPPTAGVEPPVSIVVGSKSFTESVILGEMLRYLAQQVGVEADHQRQLGGTRVLWNALLGGEIDAYPEYTGTLLREVLVKENPHTQVQLKQALASHSLRMIPPLGFNNTMPSA